MGPPNFDTMDAASFADYLRAQGEQLELPDGLVKFAGTLTGIEAADGKGPRKFEIQANSGKPFAHPWWGMFAIDFDGLEIPKQKMPVLGEHRSSGRLGVTSEVKIEAGRLVARGKFLTNTAAAAMFADHDEGFPFEASVFVPPSKIEYVPHDTETKVNGYAFKGPGHIFRRSVLREITVSTLGADPQTSAVALAGGRSVSIPKPEQAEQEIMTLPKKTEAETPAAPAPEQFTAESLKAQQPELVRSIEAAAFKAGVTSERERATEILAACHDRQITKATQLVKDGLEVKDAFKALLADQASFRKETLTELKEGIDNVPAGPSPRDDGKPAAPAANDEQLEEVTLKKRKLHLKDQMEAILREHRQGHAHPTPA